mmetsp:Transcript_21843/g.33825  ORF Transcript_21843/g.33825 Transcript_21843/m.33825 type:complete len:87 (-) Transcript_21843:1030-1290(-)
MAHGVRLAVKVWVAYLVAVSDAFFDLCFVNFGHEVGGPPLVVEHDLWSWSLVGQGAWICLCDIALVGSWEFVRVFFCLVFAFFAGL